MAHPRGEGESSRVLLSTNRCRRGEPETDSQEPCADSALPGSACQVLLARCLGTYYQYANRLAFLYFLNVIARVPARLVFLYFTGDRFPDGRPCPATIERWNELINARRLTLGLEHEHALTDRVHTIFLPCAAPMN